MTFSESGIHLLSLPFGGAIELWMKLEQWFHMMENSWWPWCSLQTFVEQMTGVERMSDWCVFSARALLKLADGDPHWLTAECPGPLGITPEIYRRHIQRYLRDAIVSLRLFCQALQPVFVLKTPLRVGPTTERDAILVS